MIKDYYVHPTATVDLPCHIGGGTKIWHYSHVMKNSAVGENCVLGQNVHIASGAVLGCGVRVQNNVSVYGGVTCGDDVFLGPSCVFTNVINPRAFVNRRNEYKRTVIENGASIGANATVICGVTVGKYALVGAGAVVTSDVEPYTVVVGSPARKKGYICACGEPLCKNQQLCAVCGRSYNWQGDKPAESED